MKQNSLKPSSSSSSSSRSETQTVTAHRDATSPSCDDYEFANIQQEIRNSMIKRESFLDDFCETLVDSKSVFSTRTTTSTIKNPQFKQLELAQPSSFAGTKATHHTNDYSQSNGRKQTFDPKTKNSLLASLKNIDNGSFET